MPKVQEESRQVASRKGNRQQVQVIPVAIPLQNRYTVLDIVRGDDPSGLNRSVRQGCVTEPGAEALQGKVISGTAIVVGDSTVSGGRRSSGEN